MVRKKSVLRMNVSSEVHETNGAPFQFHVRSAASVFSMYGGHIQLGRDLRSTAQAGVEPPGPKRQDYRRVSPGDSWH